MKRCITLLAALCMLILPLGSETEAAQNNVVIIDVIDGRFLVGDLSYELCTDEEKPIALGFLGGEALVALQTPEDSIELNLGKVAVEITERAVPYVREMEINVVESAEEMVVCPICGRSTAVGNHTLLPCSHYGCLMVADHLRMCSACNRYMCNGKDHSVCKHCGQHQCAHVNLECPYARNPAPTYQTTKTPEGKTVQGYIAEDGTSVYGNPIGMMPTWAPGMEYGAKVMASPSPGASGGGASVGSP